MIPFVALDPEEHGSFKKEIENCIKRKSNRTSKNDIYIISRENKNLPPVVFINKAPNEIKKNTAIQKIRKYFGFLSKL